VSPSRAASDSVQRARSSRNGPPRRGRCQATQVTTACSPGAIPSSAAASARSVSTRTSGASSRSRSGDSALTSRSRADAVAPALSRRPTSPIALRPACQATTSLAHRWDRSNSSQSSYPCVGSQSSVVPASTSVSSPAAYAISSRVAACTSSTPAFVARARSSRNPIPPVRSTGMGSAPRRSSNNSVCRTRSRAAPAAARSAIDCETLLPSRGGGTGRVDACTRPPRRCSPIWRGSTTVLPSLGTTRPRASSRSTGVRADAIVTARSALSTLPVGGPQVSLSSTALASGPASAISLSRSPKCRVVTGPSPAGVGPSNSWTARIGRRSSSVPQTSASARSSSSAGTTASTGWSTPRASVGRSTGSGRADSASRTSTENSSSRLTARAAEPWVVARAASWPVSAGTGDARSGRDRTSLATASSSQLRNASPSVRCLVRPVAVSSPTLPSASAGPMVRSSTLQRYGVRPNTGTAQ
jgi:hypothetical protein